MTGRRPRVDGVPVRGGALRRDVARERVADTTVPLVERIRSAVNGRLLLAVGFCVSSAEHVRELAPAADGIIVGSAVVAALDDSGARGVATLVAGLAAATARVARSL